MPEFELTLPGKVVFGTGAVNRLGTEAKAFGNKCLLVHGSNPFRVYKARESLVSSRVETILFGVEKEPSVDLVREGARTVRATGCRLVVGVGGGSVLDAAKAAAALAANPGDVMDYLEVVGAGKTLPEPSLPCVAVPTTAGTGTEATRNAVLLSPAHRVKASLRHPSMVPRVALLDPELTLSVPSDLTAATGMDALCQLIEPFTCNRPNAFTDALCREGMARSARSLLRAYSDEGDLEAREDLMMASHFSGLSLANARLGAVHGFAAPLGGQYAAPHGALCAALLPSVVLANLEALKGREPSNPALARYREAARILTGNPQAAPEDVATFTERLRREMGIPRLKEMGIRREDFKALCEKAARSSSMKGNPVELSMEELRTVLENSY
jgi:alcohol dehydrogenase class IV